MTCEQAIRGYFGSILAGGTVACEKMKQVARIVLDELDHGSKSGRWHFDERYAMKHVAFIERFCRLPSGRLGAPFRLELFQRASLSVIFGFVDDAGVRQYFMLPHLLGLGVRAMESGGCAVRVFSRERMLVELLRSAGTLPMDYYRELIGSYLGSRASSKCTRWRTVWCCTEAPTRSST